MQKPAQNEEQLSHASVIQALKSSGGIYSAAALMLGVTRQTVSNYVKRHPHIYQASLEATEDVLDLAETKLIQKIKEGHMTALIFYLKTKGKERGYIETREVTGKDGVPLGGEPTTLDLSKLSMEEKKRLLALHRKAQAEEDPDGEADHAPEPG